MRFSPFWADVLRPAFHALAPAEGRVVAGRVRNAAATAAVLAALLPEYAPLGTGTLAHVNLLTAVYAAALVGAHLRRNAPRGDAEAVGLLVLAGLVPWWFSSGQAFWGLWLAVAAASQLLGSRWRRSSVELPPPPVERDPQPARTSGLPVTIGRFAYTLATVLVFWTLVTQHTKVPTGSMQPTILGDHGPGGRYGGDRLLADHMAYLLHEPRRFDIVVFRYPLRRDILFVKRLIGLPNETVEIKGGDVWVDGAVARKPPLVQESLWQEVFPRRAAAPSARPKGVADAWGRLGSEDEGWSKEGPDALRLRPRGDAPSLVPYREHLSVPDVRVRCDVASDASAEIVLRVESRGQAVELHVAGADSKETSRLIAPDAPPEQLHVRHGATTRVELAVADGLARALVDGREVARAELSLTRSGRTRVAIGGGGGELVFRGVLLSEDVEWVDAGGLTRFDVPPDGYVVLGDNSRNSEDSRLWRGRVLHVAGRDTPYVAEDASTDMAGGMVRNVVREGGRVRFVDSDGFPRDLDAASIVREDPPEHMPYVQRDDLVGRAALIFWPVPPFAETFRPRLLP